MGINQSELEKSNVILVGFDEKKIGSSGSIKLPISLRGVMQLTTLLVIDTALAYNAILGRPWIHTMKAVLSTLHQKIKFPTLNEI